MTTTFDLLSVSLVILFLVLMILLLLCWMLRQSKRDVTVLQISTGQPPRTMTIKTRSADTQQLLDNLLDRVVFLDDTRAQPRGEVSEGHGSVPGEETLQELIRVPGDTDPGEETLQELIRVPGDTDPGEETLQELIRVPGDTDPGEETVHGHGSVPGEETLEEQGEIGEEVENIQQPDPGASTADLSTACKTLKTLPTKMRQWFDAAPHPCRDQASNLCSQQSVVSGVSHVAGSCCCLPCGKREDEDHPHDETQL